MNEYIIKEDRSKLFCYTLLNLLLTIVLMILSAYLYVQGIFILAFFAITGIWFSTKAMCKYGSKWLKKTPVCEFTKEGVIIHSMPKKEGMMNYRDIKEVKILIDAKSVKLFFLADNVRHPSGWNYAGAIYLFQRNMLKEVEENSIHCFRTHHVKYSIVEKM